MLDKQTSDAEWRQLILSELTALRTDFQNFRLEVVEQRGERKGRLAVISGVVSFIVSAGIALLHSVVKAAPLGK